MVIRVENCHNQIEGKRNYFNKNYFESVLTQ